ncbi:MAG: peroxiredoxin family protein [Saprospiraceae bacterium]
MKYVYQLLRASLRLLPVIALITACNGQGSSGYHVKGKIENAKDLQVVLEQTFFDRTNTPVGRVACNAEGAFDIKSEKPFSPGLYLLTVGPKRLLLILDGSEKSVEIKGNLETVDRMEIAPSGSKSLDCYAKIVQDLVKNPLTDISQATEVIQKGCSPLMKALLTTQLLGNVAGQHLDQFKKAAAELSAEMSDNKYAIDYQNMIASLEQQISAQNAQENAGPIRVGAEAPDITLPDPEGKMRSLSSLRGKVVLLDFWASWCGPCRRENPNVVRIYNQYKSKGFEVFSVSLDGADPRQGLPPEMAAKRVEDGKNKWIQAIKQDGLVWENHVSDLRNWGSAPAQVYGVSSIPRTFLISRDGKILAINPRANLEEELKKHL